MNSPPILASTLYVLCLAACAEEGTSPGRQSVDVNDAAVTRFESSGCKPETKGVPGSTDSKVACVDFRRDGTKLSLTLRDFTEGCGFPPGEEGDLWKAKVSSADDEELSLEVFWDFEAGNACGVCTYDWQVDVDLTTSSDPTNLTVLTRSCTGDSCFPETYNFVLGPDISGIVCEGE